MRQPQIKYTENADNACDGYAHHETQQTRNSNQSKTDLCGIKVLDTLFFFFYQELVMPIDMVLDTTLKVIMVIVIIYLAVFNNYNTLQRNRKK